MSPSVSEASVHRRGEPFSGEEANTNTNAGNNGGAANGGGAAMTTMIRRREKRRHVTSQSIDLRDPYAVIALAIRYDEAMASRRDGSAWKKAINDDDDDDDADSLLKVPLETGPIYNPKAFAKALSTLQKQTAVPSSSSRNPPQAQRRLSTTTAAEPSSSSPSAGASSPRSKKAPSPRNSSPTTATTTALTPVILSGLVAALQEQEQDDNKNNAKESGPSAVELVAYCRTMRRAALSRIRLRRQRRRLQRRVMPFVVLGGLLAVGLWSTASRRAALKEYQFSSSLSSKFSCQSRKACRLAATRIWEFCDPSDRLEITDCTLDNGCPPVEGQFDYPIYALHTLARIAFLPLSEIDRPQSQVSTKRFWPRRRAQTAQNPEPALRWLGNSNLNQLVRESIAQYHSSSTGISMLDCGCGIGGTLYSMLDEVHPPAKPFRYHGIALSAPEIYQAQQYLKLHQLDTPNAAQTTHSDIRFEQRDYDDPFPTTTTPYSVIVAIESLSYSPDLSHTIHNLVSSVLASKGGMLVIMDDVLNPWVSDEAAQELREAMGTPSLRTYQDWKRIVATENPSMTLRVAWDLTVEFDLRDLVGAAGGSKAGWIDLWVEWRYRIVQTLAGKWTAWFGGGKDAENDGPMQLPQLAKNLAEKGRATRARQQAYARADLGYYHFIFTKD